MSTNARNPTMSGFSPTATDTRENLVKTNLALKASIHDIYHCQGPSDALEKLNAQGRRLIAEFRKLIQDLESCAKEENNKRVEEELLADVKNYREQLLSTTTEFKKANIACMQAIEKANKEQLLSAETDPNAQLRNRTKKDKANLIKKSTNITDRLLSISRHLAETTERNSKTLDSLVISSSNVTGIQDELMTTGSVINQSGKLVRKYDQREFTSKLMIFAGFALFLAVCLSIFYNRLF